MKAAVPRQARASDRMVVVVSTIFLYLLSTPSAEGFSIGSAGARNVCRRVDQWPGRYHFAGAQRAGSSLSRVSRRVLADGSSSAQSLHSMPVGSTAEETMPGAKAQDTLVERSTGLGADAAVASADVSKPQSQRLQVATLFFLWYSFNVGYNLTTKYTSLDVPAGVTREEGHTGFFIHLLSAGQQSPDWEGLKLCILALWMFLIAALPLPVVLAAVQLLVGVPYVWIIWLTGLRKAPPFSLPKLRQATPVASAHTLAHLAAVVSIGAGAVGFVHVVKGAEPLFTSALSVLTGSQMPWPVYLTLLPIIGGVGMASAGELSFSAVAFAAAMTSNACAASRSVLGKMFMAREEEDGGSIDAGNLYAVMTMMGCLVLTPLALALEGQKVAGVWNAALQAGYSPRSLIKTGLLSGLFFYLYNEVSFYALNIVHPVTHALGNTLKRVVMITVSVLVLGHKFTPLGLVGCCTAIGGVLSYSVAKAKLMSDDGSGDKKDRVPAAPHGMKAVTSPAPVAGG